MVLIIPVKHAKCFVIGLSTFRDMTSQKFNYCTCRGMRRKKQLSLVKKTEKCFTRIQERKYKKLHAKYQNR